MREMNRFGLLAVLFLALLSLTSCMPNSITNEPTLISPSAIPTQIRSTATYNPTDIPSTVIPPSPTENSPLIPNGRVLFVRDSLENDVSLNGLVLFSLKTNEFSLIVHKNEELNDQVVSLSYPNITWSPDGHWIAFVGTDFSKPISLYAYEDIYIVKSDGTALRRLTYSPYYNKRDIAWSPDGKHLLVAMGINKSDLYIIDSVNGEIIKRLTSSGDNYVAVWSPDGDKIAYLEDSTLLIMNVIDKATEQVNIPSDYHVLDISWSPTGEKIAYVASVDNSKCSDIFTVDISTGVITDLTASDYYERSPDWLPNGNHLVLLRSTVTCDEMGGKRDWNIYVRNLVSEDHKIVSNTGSETSLAWAPVPNLETGKQYTITKLGANLNLRTEPSLNGKILEKLPAGEIIAVLDGYVDANDYYWWKIQTQDGTEGWAVEVANWYKPLND